MPTPISTQTHVRNIDNVAIFITQLGKKFGVMKLSMWMIYVLGPIHDNFISWWQVCMLIWHPDKIFRNPRNNKRSRELSIISMEILTSGTDQIFFWNLCLHAVCQRNWIRYTIQQCHCFIARQPSSAGLSYHCLMQRSGGQYLRKSCYHLCVCNATTSPVIFLVKWPLKLVHAASLSSAK